MSEICKNEQRRAIRVVLPAPIGAKNAQIR